MNRCPKCQRAHSGICGIPPGVTLGFGARVGGSTRSNPPIKGKPRVNKLGVLVLKEMLRQARTHEKKIADMLKIIPVELPEYDLLLDRLAKVEALILQLNKQIIERESR